MNKKTEDDYRKLAANFYAKHMDPSLPITPKNITDALINKAGDFRPGYFRRLKNALAFDQQDKKFDKAAERIRAVKNPLTVKDAPPILKQLIKPKQKRIKAVAKKDLTRLEKVMREKGDTELLAVLVLADTLGCRPNEMLGVKVLEDGQVYVPGSKKADFVVSGRKVSRGGCERFLQLGNTSDIERVEWAVKVLRKAKPGKSGVIHKLQSRMDRLTAKIWPRRKAWPTLYSFRHQLGADLKASGLDRKAIAYLMGHQSTESVEVYGNSRNPSGRSLMAPGVNRALINTMVREKHKEPYSVREKEQQVQKNQTAPDPSMGF